jgi:hypothetical protein
MGRCIHIWKEGRCEAVCRFRLRWSNRVSGHFAEGTRAVEAGGMPFLTTMPFEVSTLRPCELMALTSRPFAGSHSGVGLEGGGVLFWKSSSFAGSNAEVRSSGMQGFCSGSEGS